MVTREEMDQTVAKLSEAAAAREAMWQSQMSQMKEEINKMSLLLSSRPETSVPFTHPAAPMQQQSTRGSCIVGQSEQHCDLYVEDPDSHKRLLVAKGTVHQNLGSTVHHQQMADDEVRVSVEKVIIDAPLPLTTDELKLVSHVKGTFISWPVKLVHVSTHPEASSPPRQAPSPPRQSPSPPRHVPPPTAKLTAKEKISAMVKSGYFKDRSWPVNEVVGLRNPRLALVDAVDIKSLLVHGEELSDSIIQMFMKFMHQELVRQGRINDVGFLCPVYSSTTSTEEKQEYISTRVCEVRRKVYLLPYYHSRHWQLILMCMEAHTVILLCSTHSDPVPTIKRIINDAMKTFQIGIKNKRSSQAVYPTWFQPETRRQPPASNLCGHYVMKHMYDIITQPRTKITAKRFECPDPFPDDEVDHIRNIFCEYMYDLIVKDQDNN